MSLPFSINRTYLPPLLQGVVEVKLSRNLVVLNQLEK